MITGCDHIGIQVRDVERSARFYEEHLGFKRVARWSMTEPYVQKVVGYYPYVTLEIALLSMPGTDVFLEILEYRGVDAKAIDPATANPGTGHFCLFAENLDLLYADLITKGVEFVSDPAQCEAILVHRPEWAETYDADIENLKEWLDLASFVLSSRIDQPSSEKRGRRDLYRDILACVRELERRGLTVLSGVMSSPQERLPDWKVAIICVSPKLTDPGAVKRRHIMVDRRVVALNRDWSVT